VPKPSLAAVTNAASYAQQIAPGQTVVLFGANMGPAKTAALAVDANGLASTISGGVRVLFDGVPAPIIYAGATQISAVVPYFGATKATTHVQVEYQGVRSESLAIPVAATAPGLFSADFTGKGQGAIFNQDGITRNGLASPASSGSIVTIWGTGEGITNPPGVDGRAAIDVLPKPVASVSVDIGGLPASITYAGAAPGVIPGIFQINAQIPDGVQPGNQVAVHVVIGGKSSQEGLTIAVR
jgi:trimeric autotransporter adhesin